MTAHRPGLVTALLGALVLAGCAGGPSGGPGAASPSAAGTATAETAMVRVGAQPPLRVEVARTETERERGLSGRAGLAPETGMIFVYDEPTTAEFWMRGVSFPLSLAWVRGGRVIGSVEMTPCPEGGDCRRYEPPAAFDVAIEARAGTFAGVARGTPVRVDCGRGSG